MLRALVIFDIEATCDPSLPKHKREIIEIGAVKILDGKVIDSFQCFVKPRKNVILTDYCKNLTHIKQKDINNALDPKSALTQFFQWADNAVLASWGEFDNDIVGREMHKTKLEKQFNLAFVNLKKAYLAAFKLPTKYSLIDCMRRERIKFDGEQHRAYNDAYNTYQLYMSCQEDIDKMLTLFYPKSYFI